jgi:ABC-type uncharacterized transport system permease subunit
MVGLTTGAPLTSRAEIFCLFGLSMLTVYLVVRILDELAIMGTVVIPVGLIFVVVAGLQPAPPAAQHLNQSADPGLVSWPHILLVIFAYGAFSVSFLMAVGYLRAEHQLKKKSVDGLFFMLPSLEALDHGLQRSIRIGILTLLAGVFLAMFGGFYQGTVTLAWFQDPNILGAILTGLIYGTILYIRSRSLFTNRRIAFLAIFGFLLIGVLFFVMNLFPRMHRFL